MRIKLQVCTEENEAVTEVILLYEIPPDMQLENSAMFHKAVAMLQEALDRYARSCH